MLSTLAVALLLSSPHPKPNALSNSLTFRDLATVNRPYCSPPDDNNDHCACPYGPAPSGSDCPHLVVDPNLEGLVAKQNLDPEFLTRWIA